MTADAGDPGLQPERTTLAWTRTALAAVLGGMLILLKDRDVAHLLQRPLQLGAGLLALGVSSAIFVIGTRRKRDLSARPLPAQLTARREILGIAAAVLALAGAVVAHHVAALF